jgi:IS30 family transposase
MANHLKMAKINAILTLHAQGRSRRRIAEQLGVHRDTVARHLEAATSKLTEAPTGPEAENRPQAPTGCRPENMALSCRKV